MLAIEIAIGLFLLVVLVAFTLVVNPPSAWVTKNKKKD